MKAKSFFMMLLVALVMINCNQNEYEGLFEDGITQFTAEVEAKAKTRSFMNDSGKFSWANGDQISVWNGLCFVPFTCSGENVFSSAVSVNPSGYAIYPFGSHEYENEVVTVNLPTTYGNTETVYTPNTNAVMLAAVEQGSEKLSFRHLGGLMRFNVKNVPAGAKQFKFTTNKVITGNFTVTTDGVIEAKDGLTNNSVAIEFKKLEAAQDMTFFIPLPIGEYSGYTVAISGESVELSHVTAPSIKNTIKRRTLLLMPTFTCNGTELEKAQKQNVDLGNASTPGSTPAVDVEEESVVIETNDVSVGSEPEVTLNYNPDESTPSLNISDNSAANAPQASAAIVNVEVSSGATVQTLQIDAPTLTVALTAAENGTATFETVVALTAKQTLRIKSGVTVKKLILNGGNIVIEAGATVENIVNAEGYSAETYVVNQGTLTNVPALENVHVVANETDIPTEDEGGEEEEELDYELRVLTFEDEDVQFESYVLDYVDDYTGKEITTWSDLIDDPQYSGPLLYGDGYVSGMADAWYNWYDDGNTYLYHIFPDNFSICHAGGGHAISNYVGAGYSDEDRDRHIAKYYGQEYVDQWAGQPGADAFLGWFNVQLMIPIQPHSGNNFAVHYGYKDGKNYIENLPELSFGDEVARVIDHMYVTNTNYTLNQLYNGVKSEEGNSFGGDWSGLTEDAWLKLVAYGYDSFDAEPLVDEPTSTAEIYLVKGFDVVEDWRKWDLSVLGKVAKVRFNFLYSDEMGGKYGFTIPGYFAYDDVAVRFEKE